jgi:hypothetical protein
MIKAGGNVYYLAKLAGIVGYDVQDIGAPQTGMTVEAFRTMLERGAATAELSYVPDFSCSRGSAAALDSMPAAVIVSSSAASRPKSTGFTRCAAKPARRVRSRSDA